MTSVAPSQGGRGPGEKLSVRARQALSELVARSRQLRQPKIAAAVVAFVILLGAGGWLATRPNAGPDPSAILAAQFPTWSVERYERGQISGDEGGLLIATSAPPGGVYFRQPVDPTQRQILTIQGNRTSGSVNLRVRADEGEYIWFGAPDSAAAYLSPAGAREIEVLIYADAPFEYHLSNLTVTPAGPEVVGEAWAPIEPPASQTASQSLVPGWSMELYASPQLRRSGDNVQISVEEAPAGVYFRRAMSQDQTFRLVLNGRPITNEPVLRTKIDDGSYVWHPVREGRADIALPRGSNLEVLIYGDSAFQFELRDLTLEPCSQCINDNDLRALITSEARLSSRDSPLERARKLRNWAANTIVIGPEAQLVTRVTEATVTQRPSQVYSDYFEPRAGGVSCGGAAAFLTRIYQLFGFNAFWIDIGYNGTPLTHVTTVVALGNGANQRFYVFDPTLAGMYTRNGAPIDLGQALADPRRAEFDTDLITRTVLVPKADFRAFLRDNETADTDAVCDRDSVVPYTLECRGFHHNEAYNLLMMRRSMEQNGFPIERDFILGLLGNRLIAIGPGDVDAETRASFLRMLDARGVPHD